MLEIEVSIPTIWRLILLCKCLVEFSIFKLISCSVSALREPPLTSKQPRKWYQNFDHCPISFLNHRSTYTYALYTSNDSSNELCMRNMRFKKKKEKPNRPFLCAVVSLLFPASMCLATIHFMNPNDSCWPLVCPGLPPCFCTDGNIKNKKGNEILWK